MEVKQTFNQESRTAWSYKIIHHEKVYSVRYEVTPFGYCKEKFMDGEFLIWDREFKVGERLNPTVMDIILSKKECHAV